MDREAAVAEGDGAHRFARRDADAGDAEMTGGERRGARPCCSRAG